ncbi:MAG TPA: tetratricopeptide repeat protein, partial [Ktedonobacterales bacterium]
ALFLERVSDEWQDVSAVTPDAWRQVANICVRLDGLPLALELAAARVRHVGLPQLHARLMQPTFLGVLADGAQDLADHQRTMRSTIAWSYDLLSMEEQRLFRWLGVFVGGASVEAIEAVSGIAGDTLIAGLATLLDASLLQRAGHGSARRYTQLVTLRAYAQERLHDAGEWDEARRRHAEYCMTLTDALLPKALNEAEREMARVEAEYENVRAALGWALETDAIILGLRMVAALRRFWFLYPHYLEGLDWLELYLARSAAPTTNEERALLAEAWTGVMALSHRMDQFERARDAGEMALALRQATGDKAQIAWALNNLSNPVAALGDYHRAVELCEECLALQRESGARADMVIPLLNLGTRRCAMGQPREALAYYEESLALSREAGESDWARALTWNNIGEACILLDEPTRAIEVTTPSYHLFSEKRDTFGVATCAFTLARAQWRSGDAETARAHFDEAARLFGALDNLGMVARVRYFRASLALEQGDHLAAQRDLAQAFTALAGQVCERGWIWRVVERIATLLARRGDVELAARLSAAAIARREATPRLVEPAERDMRERDLACLRASLAASALATCFAEGQALSLDAAVGLACDAVERATSP